MKEAPSSLCHKGRERGSTTSKRVTPGTGTSGAGGLESSDQCQGCQASTLAFSVPDLRLCLPSIPLAGSRPKPVVSYGCSGHSRPPSSPTPRWSRCPALRPPHPGSLSASLWEPATLGSASPHLSEALPARRLGSVEAPVSWALVGGSPLLPALPPVQTVSLSSPRKGLLP